MINYQGAAISTEASVSFPDCDECLFVSRMDRVYLYLEGQDKC